MSAAIYGPKERSRLAILADQLASAPGGGILATHQSPTSCAPNYPTWTT